MDNQKLTNFLNEFNHQVGYASNNQSAWRKESDGSTIIEYTSSDGLWRGVDKFYGGEPYAGSFNVFHEGKICWTMVYYGAVAESSSDIKGIYEFLQAALLKGSDDLPLRGPEMFDDPTKPNLKYLNSCDGSIVKYSGLEKILDGDNQIFYTIYAGGLVDQRAED